MRRAARVDDNQKSIAEALRKFGASVEFLHSLGRGVPDILCGWRGQTYLLEVKDGAKSPSERRLTPDQREWHSSWKGKPVAIVESVDDALSAVGILHCVESA